MAEQRTSGAASLEDSVTGASGKLSPDVEQLVDVLAVGERIARARQRKGWTQRELSEQMGKSRGTIVQYEQGKIEPPLRQIELLAKLLDVAPELLAFGRQGITGLLSESSRVVSLPEIKLDGDEQLVSGVYGLPESLLADFDIYDDTAKVIILTRSAPAFGLAAGDRVIINPTGAIEHVDEIYALRTQLGVEVVRLLPNLTRHEKRLSLSGGGGELHYYEPDELEVMGRVVGSIRAAHPRT